jgi:hypothetical protein
MVSHGKATVGEKPWRVNAPLESAPAPPHLSGMTRTRFALAAMAATGLTGCATANGPATPGFASLSLPTFSMPAPSLPDFGKGFRDLREQMGFHPAPAANPAFTGGLISVGEGLSVRYEQVRRLAPLMIDTQIACGQRAFPRITAYPAARFRELHARGNRPLPVSVPLCRAFSSTPAYR